MTKIIFPDSLGRSLIITKFILCLPVMRLLSCDFSGSKGLHAVGQFDGCSCSHYRDDYTKTRETPLFSFYLLRYLFHTIC